MKKLMFILLIMPMFAFAKETVFASWERFMDPTNNWTTLKMYRMAVPHGWLVQTGQSTTIFVPDENHEWILDPASIAMLRK